MLVVAEHGMIAAGTRCGYLPVIVTIQQRIVKESGHRDQQNMLVLIASRAHGKPNAMMVHDIGDDKHGIVSGSECPRYHGQLDAVLGRQKSG